MFLSSSKICFLESVILRAFIYHNRGMPNDDIHNYHIVHCLISLGTEESIEVIFLHAWNTDCINSSVYGGSLPLLGIASIRLFMGRKVFITVPRNIGNLVKLSEQSLPVMLQDGLVINEHGKHLKTSEKDIYNL